MASNKSVVPEAKELFRIITGLQMEIILYIVR